MSTGRAVVAFDCRSGPADLIEPEVNGLLVPAGDVSALAAALDRLMANPALRTQLGAAAQLVRERLSLTSILGQWDELLQSAGAGRLESPALLRKSA
jgi:glycosyltransferase involved in cell wall biosynthesis